MFLGGFFCRVHLVVVVAGQCFGEQLIGARLQGDADLAGVVGGLDGAAQLLGVQDLVQQGHAVLGGGGELCLTGEELLMGRMLF